MGLADLRIEHIRASKHWNKRHERLRQLKQLNQWNPSTSKLHTTNGTTHQPMDLELYEAAKKGDVDVFITALEKFSESTKSPLLATICSHLTSQKDTFLHVSASYGHEELTGFIAHHFGELIVCKNSRGDSALHLAARGGHFGVVEILVKFREDKLSKDYFWDDDLVLTDKERLSLIRQRVEERVLVNDEGNTALHEAFLNDHKDVVEYLMDRNTEAAYYANKQGRTPLYMAVEAGNIEYVKTMLQHTQFYYMGLLGERSRYMDVLHEKLTQGKSLLHAAIKERNIEILKEIAEQKPFLIHLKDGDGQSPLDFASSTAFLEGLNYLQDKLKKDTSAIDMVNANQDLHKHVPDLKIEDIRQSEHWQERHKRLEKLLDAKIVEKNISRQSTSYMSNSMNISLYIAAKNGDIDTFIDALKKIVENDSPLQTIEKQLTPLQNTVLHVAASFGNEDLTGLIVHHFRSLLSKRNHKGDTPLHLAARAGHLDVVDILTRFQKDQLRKDSLLDVDIEKNNETLIGKLKDRLMVNDEGNTPLHESLINNHDKVVEYLIKANVEEAYYVNNEGKSALYMAVEAQKIDVVTTILSTVPLYTDQGILDEEITRGKSLIHAAITTRNIVLLQEVAKTKPAVIYAKDEYGQSPLHYAASTGFLEGVHFLLNEIKMDAFETDGDGFYPIHLASKSGHVGILETLLHHCPDAREFINQDGQNILHVAAKYGKDSIARYILKTPGLELLTNEKDKDGNTPLHLAALNWHPKVVTSLIWDRKVNENLVNNEGLTALETSEEYMESMPPYRKRLTWMVLKSAGFPTAKVRKTPKIVRVQSTQHEPYNMDYCKDRVNTLLLVATLVATVTFAAGFTMPGGYNNAEPNQGMATLLGEHMFYVFVICDTIAMYSAILVAVTLIWAQLGDLTLVLNALRLAIPLLGISLTMMSLAFMASVYLVVSKLVWLANVGLAMGIISLASLLALFVPLILPYSSNFLIFRYISYYPSCLLMLASGCYYDNDEHSSL